MAAKLIIGFFLKSTKEMSEDDMPHDGSEAFLGQMRLRLLLNSTDAITYWQKRAGIFDK
jgi:hypothetical protein